MSDKQQPKGVPVHIRLPETTRAMLDEMAGAEMKSITYLLREMIEDKHRKFQRAKA